MNRNKFSDLIKKIKKLSRKDELERRKNEGFSRSKSWGGVPSAKKERHEIKKKLRQNFDYGDTE